MYVCKEMKLIINYIDYAKELNIKDSDYSDKHERCVEFLLQNQLNIVSETVQVDSKVPKEWFDACTNYILKEITPNDRITLFTYTTVFYGIINEFRRGLESYKKFFKVSSVKDASHKRLISSAFKALKDKDKPYVNKLYKQFEKAETEKKSDEIINEFETWLKDQPEGIPYEKIQANYNAVFFEKSVAFLPQMRILHILTVAQLRKKYLMITLPQWRRIMIQYQNDITRIFKGSPPLPETLTVYRGTRQLPKTSWKGLISTSLSKKVTKRFMSKTKKCCFETIEVPKGGHVLPILSLSALNIEQVEMLLESYPSKTRKLK